MRAVEKKPGMLGTAESAGGWHNLPEGMPNPCPVKILECGPGIQEILVEGAGRLWMVPHWLVDCGFEFFVAGKWVHESDPRILKRLSQAVNTRTPGFSTDFRKMAEKILTRNRAALRGLV